MASVLNKTTKQYIPSVNTPDYMDGNWLINPNMSVVSGHPEKYWIIEGTTLRLATTAERAVIDKSAPYMGMTIPQTIEALHQQINMFRDSYINAGVVYKGHLFDSDARARENIMGMSNAITVGVQLPADFTWRSHNNEDVPMTAPELIDFGIRMMMFVSKNYGVSWYHKDTLTNLGSTNQLDYINYNFTVGWPTNSIDGSTLA